MPATEAARVVGLSLPPGDAFVRALDATWARGDVALPLDPNAPADVLRRTLDGMGAATVVDAAGEQEYAADAPAVEVDDAALVIATSGSTGEPKGALLTHGALQASAAATQQRIGVRPDDSWLSCLPWQHIGGLQVLLRSQLAGTPLTVHERFDVTAVAETAATLVSLVPTQLARLLDAGVDLSRFRVILLGGAPASASLLQRAADAGAPVTTTYGMSETCGGCVYDGRPLDGVDVRLGDGGRVEIAGPVLMAGYRLRRDLTAEALSDGWLLTHDVGEYDDAGRLRIVGRTDDIVISGGENVATPAVADVLAGHPAVADVAVTGVPDPQWGQRVVAVAVPRPAASVTLDELRAWSADRLAAAALPRSLVLVGELPRLASGKPDRLAVRRIAQATLIQSVDAGSCE